MAKAILWVIGGNMSLNREYAKGERLPDWLKEFADDNLKKGSEFEEISDLINIKNNLNAVEERVKELQNRVGLDKVIIKAEENIKGGLADGMSDSQFDQNQIEMGINIEKEHTNDKEIAKEIAKDHLVEHGKYYDYLAEMEKEMEKDNKLSFLLKPVVKSMLDLSNYLDEKNMFKQASQIDDTLYDMVRFASKKKENSEEISKLYDLVEQIAQARQGYIDVPALIELVKREISDDIEMSDKDKENLREFVSEKIDENKGEPQQIEMPRDHTILFVITEEDEAANNKVFDIK